MNDLNRLERYYKEKFLIDNYWQDFNCYPFYLSQTQYAVIIKILKDFGINSNIKLFNRNVLDIGAGEGNFLLSLIKLGANIRNITAVELIDTRYEKLKEKLANANVINQDYLEFKPDRKFDIITIMAVLSSVLDKEIESKIIHKAYSELNVGGIIIIYDYNKPTSKVKLDNYRPISFESILSELCIEKDKYRIYSNIYINARIGKALCRIGFGYLIPFIQTFKLLNDNYSFLVIKK